MGKAMCKLTKKEYFKKVKSGTDYYCDKCSRESSKKKKLCKALKRQKAKD